MEKAEKDKILQELGGIPEEIYNDLVKELLVQIKLQIPEMREQLKQGDMEGLGKVIHSIKGSSGNLRLRKVEEIAKRINVAARESGDTESMEDDLIRMEEAVGEVEKYF